jgi:hypothetical protein
MNRSIAGFAFTALIALLPWACGSAADETTASCPLGSFSETCGTPACSASAITASCRQQDGVTYATSTLSLPCAASVTNCNGQLTCGSCPVPSGSYVNSCSGCVASSRLLTCLSCTDELRTGHETSLALPCSAGVSNCNGQLVCGPATGC